MVIENGQEEHGTVNIQTNDIKSGRMYQLMCPIRYLHEIWASMLLNYEYITDNRMIYYTKLDWLTEQALELIVGSNVLINNYVN